MPRTEYSFKLQDGKEPRRFEEIADQVMGKTSEPVSVRLPQSGNQTIVNLEFDSDFLRNVTRSMRKLGYDLSYEKYVEV